MSEPQDRRDRSSTTCEYNGARPLSRRHVLWLANLGNSSTNTRCHSVSCPGDLSVSNQVEGELRQLLLFKFLEIWG